MNRHFCPKRLCVPAAASGILRYQIIPRGWKVPLVAGVTPAEALASRKVVLS